MKKPELLAPAGNMDCLKAAISAGCDAVYLSGKIFGARAYANNFTNEELIEAINYAHLFNVKVYVTINTMINEELVNSCIKYIAFLHKNNVDALIMSDIGMIDYARKTYPNLEIHVSTQSHIHNLQGAKFIESLGIKRVVLARETNIDTLKDIKKNTNIQLEVFIHGALCICYSGQCLMSSLIGARSGNKGTCSQCCRMKYSFMHEDKIINKNNYLLSAKDLNTLDYIGDLIDIGIDSLKIEGRMKSKEYVYYVTKLYRMSIDSYIEKKEINITDEEITNLKKIFNREFTKGFLNNEDNNNFINSYRPNNIGIKVGRVIDYKNGYVKIKLIDDLNLKDGIRILSSEDYGLTIYKMKKNNNYVESAYKDDIIELKIDKKVSINDIVVKTTDYKLINEIDDLIKKGKKIKIKGTITCKLNEPIILKISDSINNIEVKSNIIVEPSIKRPITKEEIKKQISKLGNTIYEFEELNIISDDNIFINIKQLNDLRRDVVDKLNNKRLYKIPYKKCDYNVNLDEYKEEKGYSYFIHNIDEYNKISNSAKDIITDNIDLYNKISSDDKIILKIPRVVKEYINIDKKVLIGEFGSISKYNDKISDFSFNIANSYSVAFMHSNNIKRVTLSLELNKYQIKNIVDKYIERYNKKPNLEVIVSSIPESMVSKFNLIKYLNISNNDNYLIDKFNNKFKVEIKDDLMYIYHFKKIEIDNYKELFDFGINTLRIEC